MSETKCFERFCPVCGELYQSCQLVKLRLLAGAQVAMICPVGHRWTEFYGLIYQGYQHNGKVYDTCGEEKLE